MRLLYRSVAFVFAAFLSITGASAPPSTEVTPVIPDSTISSIRLERHGCLMGCPVYTLIFWDDGTAVYRGEYGGDRQGTFSGASDFKTIAAWLDDQRIDSQGGGFGLNWMDSEGLRLTVTRKSGPSTSIVTNNVDYLPLEVRGVIAALDGFADRVRWKDVNAQGPPMGYYYYEGDLEFDILDIYPGDSPSTVEAYIDEQSGSACDRSITMSSGPVALKIVSGSPTALVSADSQSKMTLSVTGHDLRVTLNGKSQTYAHTSFDSVRSRRGAFLEQMMGHHRVLSPKCGSNIQTRRAITSHSDKAQNAVRHADYGSINAAP